MEWNPCTKHIFLSPFPFPTSKPLNQACPNWFRRFYFGVGGAETSSWTNFQSKSLISIAKVSVINNQMKALITTKEGSKLLELPSAIIFSNWDRQEWWKRWQHHGQVDYCTWVLQVAATDFSLTRLVSRPHKPRCNQDRKYLSKRMIKWLK